MKFDIPQGYGKINITLFKMKGVTLTKLSGPDVDVTVSNLKSLQDSNADLYVLVSNARAVSPYTTESEIDLKIKVEHQLWANYPNPEYCSLNGAAGSNVIIDTNDNPDDVTYVTCSYYGGDYGDYSGQLNQEIPYTNGEENGYAKFYWDGVLSGYYIFINGSIQ